MKSLLSQGAVVAVALLLWGQAAPGAEFPEFTRLVEQNSAAVVSINATGKPRAGKPELFPPIPEDSPFYEYFKRFFEDQPGAAPKGRRPASVGSGFVISADGYILTNSHVVEDMEQITVGLSDRRELTAKVIGTDSRSDLALLKVEADRLPTVRIGDATRLKVGQWVLAIGSPFGFEYTATQGIISALGRSLPSDNYVPFIQTDVAVNPGNSGGPLFNLDGEVIGINSQIYTRTGGYQGVSFAIPIDVAMDVVDQLKTQGKVARGWLGVLIQEVTPELAKSFGLDKPRGALVGQVMEDSPAKKAGVQVGDIIVAFDGLPVNRSSELPPLVGRIRPGNKANLAVFRNGSQQDLPVTIEELPEEAQQLATAKPLANRLRLTVKEPSGERGKEVQGVEVTAVDEEGPAADAGIRPGDIIISLNNEAVSGVPQFDALVKKLPAGKPLPVLIQRGEGRLFLALTIPEEK